MITIITASWNAENLPKVIESIDNQTYTDWHHIIINDNNPEVREIMKGLCDNKKRFWIDFGLRTHFYGALARNTGAMIAFCYIHHSKRDIENEWICFHDDDNLWDPSHLESIVDTLNKNPESTLIASDAVWVGANDKNWRGIKPCRIKHGSCDLGQFMYKTKLFKEYGYFDPCPRRKHKYDIELIKKIAEGEGERISYTNQPTFIMNYKKR